MKLETFFVFLFVFINFSILFKTQSKIEDVYSRDFTLNSPFGGFPGAIKDMSKYLGQPGYIILTNFGQKFMGWKLTGKLWSY